MGRCTVPLFVALICVKVVSAAPSEGKEIADRLGDDLSFASKQVIRGFTAIFGPILDTAQELPRHTSKFTVVKDSGVGDSLQNLQHVLVRDGVNAFGKGVKASATILSAPARVAGTGLEEVRKVSQAGQASRLGAVKPGIPHINPGSQDGLETKIEDGTKIASTLLNTTSSELSQANFGAILVESALKSRIKDIGNKTTTYIKSQNGQNQESVDHKREIADDNSKDNSGGTEKTSSPRPVDELIKQFNEAVSNNDQRLLDALREVIKRINPPKE